MYTFCMWLDKLSVPAQAMDATCILQRQCKFGGTLQIAKATAVVPSTPNQLAQMLVYHVRKRLFTEHEVSWQAII